MGRLWVEELCGGLLNSAVGQADLTQCQLGHCEETARYQQIALHNRPQKVLRVFRAFLDSTVGDRGGGDASEAGEFILSDVGIDGKDVSLDSVGLGSIGLRGIGWGSAHIGGEDIGFGCRLGQRRLGQRRLRQQPWRRHG